MSPAGLGTETLRDLERASRLEWLLADGSGGYAASTVLGLNARRHHGLLVADLGPPLGRMLLLSKLEESLVVDGRRYDLSTNAYPGAIHPRGLDQAVSFSLDPLPSLTWEGPGWRLTKVVARAHAEPGVAVAYAYEGPQARLELRPLLAFREHHALQHENRAVAGDVWRDGQDVVTAPYPGCPRLHLRLPRGEFESDGLWYRGFEYAREGEAGTAPREDLFSPGRFVVEVRGEAVASLLAWAGPIPVNRAAVDVLAAERARLREARGGFEGLLGALRQAADAFLVSRREERGVVAAYPWLEESARDTLAALPGLCLASGREDDARAILAAQARRVGNAQGLAADTPLWFVVAVGRFLEATGDRDFVRTRLRDAVELVLESYRRGARPGIRLTGDGLVLQRDPARPLTWMDARVDGTPVTRRDGLAVELQALWYNAVLIGAELARQAGDPARAAAWAALAPRTREALLRTFWDEQRGYLADVVRDGVPDLALRPNQLYAVGLPHALLPRDKALRVLDAVGRALLTPAGLRSLAPDHPGYQPRFRGDASRHQGSAWPFLAGVYFEALIRLEGERGKDRARDWLRSFAAHLDEACLGQVSELFDGDPPHRPGGCLAAAWSVAELLRLALRVAGRPASPRGRPAVP